MALGLDEVIAAETVLSDVDGAAGRLVLRGEAVEDLAGVVPFEAMARRLFEGFFDPLPSLNEYTRALGNARAEAFAEVAALDERLLARGAFDAMRALIARLPDDTDFASALKLLAAPAAFTTAILRLEAGKAPAPPDPDAPHAADILRMARGRPASAAEAAALDAYLVTISDHGLNASTFAARVVASTHAGLTSAALAGLSALKGPLHGGAPGPVIAMLDAIGKPENARAWLEGALTRGQRLMGFGHRIYRVRDPRADALKTTLQKLGGDAERLALAAAVEQAALAILRERKPLRPLDVNVEFYTALLLERLSFPPEAFTCVFAMGRMAGWIAHAREQAFSGRLLRPQSRYVGPRPPKAA